MSTCERPVLDTGMTNEQAQAINFALASEKRGENLRAFAATLTPRYPVAAALLAIKANLLGGASDEYSRTPLQ